MLPKACVYREGGCLGGYYTGARASQKLVDVLGRTAEHGFVALYAFAASGFLINLDLVTHHSSPVGDPIYL
jgi:hypothetical protein